MKLDNRKSGLAKFIDRKLGILLIMVLAMLRPLLKLIQGRAPGQKRFLVIKLSALGDVVVMLPALSLIKQQYPDAEIVFLGTSANKEIVQNISTITRFESFSRGTVLKLRKESFTAVIDFDQWVRATAITAALMKTPLTLGFRSQGQYRHFAYDGTIDFTTHKHMGESFWNLASLALEKLGSSVTGTFEEDKMKVQKEWKLKTQNISLPSKYVVIHPGCGENGILRQWPVDSWKDLIVKLHSEYKSDEILITGHGAYEEALSQNIAAAGAKSMAGQISFQQLMTVLAGAKTVFSSNTGIMHLASFLGAQVVVLNGPTNPTLWGPLWRGVTLKSQLACSPCLTWGYDYGCSDPVCVKVTTPQQVFEASHA